MNKSESKYFNTANRIDEAFLTLLDKKSLEYITIKEICNLAGVNRSTFYLHYDTVDDLLTECNEYVVNKFLNCINQKNINHKSIDEMHIDELCFITPKYLIPWLEFIKQNKMLFRTYMNEFSTLTIKRNNDLLFQNVLNPVLNRFKVDEAHKEYILKFYIEGIMALVKHWVENDCNDDINSICNLIVKCVNYEKN